MNEKSEKQRISDAFVTLHGASSDALINPTIISFKHRNGFKVILDSSNKTQKGPKYMNFTKS
jgi:hypothetical protein